MAARSTGWQLHVSETASWMAARTRADLELPSACPPRPPEGGTGTGAGLRIALLDGAVDPTHPDLVNARIQTWSGVRGLGTPVPAEQATGLASLLVGQGRAQVRGLVPRAHLLVAPVLAVTPQGSDELLCRGVRWALASGAQILVLPFGRRRLGHRVATTLRYATSTGATVLAAAGDLGPHVAAFPALVSGVVAVTAYDDDGLLPQCSTRADIAAPGRDVPAAGTRSPLLLSGSAPATVLAAGARASRLSDPQLSGDPSREAGERYRLVDA